MKQNKPQLLNEVFGYINEFFKIKIHYVILLTATSLFVLTPFHPIVIIFNAFASGLFIHSRRSTKIAKYIRSLSQNQCNEIAEHLKMFTTKNATHPILRKCSKQQLNELQHKFLTLSLIIRNNRQNTQLMPELYLTRIFVKSIQQKAKLN